MIINSLTEIVFSSRRLIPARTSKNQNVNVICTHVNVQLQKMDRTKVENSGHVQMFLVGVGTLNGLMKLMQAIRDRVAIPQTQRLHDQGPHAFNVAEKVIGHLIAQMVVRITFQGEIGTKQVKLKHAEEPVRGVAGDGVVVAEEEVAKNRKPLRLAITMILIDPSIQSSLP